MRYDDEMPDVINTGIVEAGSALLGRTLLYLGDAADTLGRADEARRHWTDAAGVCESVRDRVGMAAADARPIGGHRPSPEASQVEAG